MIIPGEMLSLSHFLREQDDGRHVIAVTELPGLLQPLRRLPHPLLGLPQFRVTTVLLQQLVVGQATLPLLVTPGEIPIVLHRQAGQPRAAEEARYEEDLRLVSVGTPQIGDDLRCPSDDERLLYVSDTVLYPLHLEHPDWLPIYDILPDQAEPSKQRIFDLAAKEGTWVIGQHFPPFPSLGHVVKKGEGWEWQPIEGL